MGWILISSKIHQVLTNTHSSFHKFALVYQCRLVKEID